MIEVYRKSCFHAGTVIRHRPNQNAPMLAKCFESRSSLPLVRPRCHLLHLRVPRLDLDLISAGHHAGTSSDIGPLIMTAHCSPSASVEKLLPPWPPSESSPASERPSGITSIDRPADGNRPLSVLLAKSRVSTHHTPLRPLTVERLPQLLLLRLRWGCLVV